MRRFTLVELMIVVAVVAILATVGVPLLADMQLRARLAERGPILDGIDQALLQRHLEDPTLFLEATAWNPDPGVDVGVPGTPLPKGLHPMDPGAPGWSDLTFEPDGDVRCYYAFQLLGVASPAKDGMNMISVQGVCDLDANGVYNIGWLTRDTPGDVTRGAGSKYGDDPSY